VWGGEKEQEAEQEAGIWGAKNWQDEARKVLELTVHHLHLMLSVLTPSSAADGTLLEDTHTGTKGNT